MLDSFPMNCTPPFLFGRSTAVDLVVSFNASAVSTKTPEKLVALKTNITGALTVLNNTLDATLYSLVPETAANVDACKFFLSLIIYPLACLFCLPVRPLGRGEGDCFCLNISGDSCLPTNNVRVFI